MRENTNRELRFITMRATDGVQPIHIHNHTDANSSLNFIEHSFYLVISLQ